MKALIIAGLFALALPANAQHLYRCVGKDGAVSIQSEPCPAGSRVDRVVPYTPEREEPAWQRRQRIQREMDARHAAQRPRGTARGAVLHAYAGRNPDACQAAKAHRAEVLERVGMRRSLELLRSLDDAVYEACK